jgi:hypothetical protein
MSLTPELEKYYEHYFDMFNSKGWKQLMEEVDESINVFRIENLNTEKELFLARGQLVQLNTLKNLQAVIEQAYEELQDDS